MRRWPWTSAPSLCGRGVCAALKGHPGSCAEASGWADFYGRHTPEWFTDAGKPFITVEHLRFRDNAVFKAAIARLRAAS